MNIWARTVRWLAREHIAYLEYENKELRYEGECWRHRYEGAIGALEVFETRYRYMEQSIVDAQSLQPLSILKENKS